VSALDRVLREAVENQPTPPRRIEYLTVLVAVLRQPRVLVLFLLGVGMAGFAGLGGLGPDVISLSWALTVLGLALAFLPLFDAWSTLRTIQTGVVTPAVVESVSHAPEPNHLAIPNEFGGGALYARGEWRLPDGRLEPFQTTAIWTTTLRAGSVVDLLIYRRSVIIIGPHHKSET
jgi:hypothetical protein